jgi:hypothetical protein
MIIFFDSHTQLYRLIRMHFIIRTNRTTYKIYLKQNDSYSRYSSHSIAIIPYRSIFPRLKSIVRLYI